MRRMTLTALLVGALCTATTGDFTSRTIARYIEGWQGHITLVREIGRATMTLTAVPEHFGWRDATRLVLRHVTREVLTRSGEFRHWELASSIVERVLLATWMQWIAPAIGPAIAPDLLHEEAYFPVAELNIPVLVRGHHSHCGGILPLDHAVRAVDDALEKATDGAIEKYRPEYISCESR